MIEAKRKEEAEMAKMEEEMDSEIEGAVEESDPEADDLSIRSLPGVGAATAEKLQSGGFADMMSIAVASPGQLAELVGMTEAGARKVIQAARAKLKMGFESGEELLKKRLRLKRISTGSKAFDQLLGGGLETGAITEIYSEYGGGKTQIGHVLSVMVQKLEGEKDPVAVYIDTENTFRPERIMQIAEGAGVDPKKALKNVKIARAYNSDHQMLLVEKVEDLIRQGNNVKLVVVDSLTAHFRAEFIGRGTLADRQQKLNKHMHVLLKLADSYNLVVYVTNQVMAKPDQFFGDPTTAIGGHIVGHASTFRIYIRKGKKGSRVAKLIDSPSLPEGEVGFFLTEQGLKDL